MSRGMIQGLNSLNRVLGSILYYEYAKIIYYTKNIITNHQGSMSNYLGPFYY